MVAGEVGLDKIGTNGDKIAAETIGFGAAVERRGPKTVGVHMSTVIDNCQTAWIGKANVTATSEASAKKVNAKGTKLVIDASFSTGLVATKDFDALDLSLKKVAGLWMQSDIAIAAGVLGFVIDEHSACASPSETLLIPALAAGQWRYVKLPFDGAQSGRNAIISVGITAIIDPGAATLFIDQVNAGSGFIGIAENDSARDSYVAGNQITIIDQGKAIVDLEVGETCLAGDALIPVGNGKFGPDSAGGLTDIGTKTLLSRMTAVNDQAVAAGEVAGRMM